MLGRLYWHPRQVASVITRFTGNAAKVFRIPKVGKIKSLLTGNTHRYLEPAGIAIVLFSIFNATLPANLAASHDSITYLESIEASQTPWLFHSHHLLYEVLGRAFWQSWKLLGYMGDALLPLQELNVIFACLSIAVLYALLKEAFISRRKSLLVCCAVASSFGFWFYSGTVEVYIIPLFFLLLCFGLSYRAFQKPSLKIFAAVGVINAISILFHQMNILFGGVVLVAIFLNYRLPSLKAKLLVMTAYMACLLLPVIITYLLAMSIKVGPISLENAYYWLTGYLHSEELGKLEILSPAKALIGFSNTFIGGHFLFSIEPFDKLASSVFSGKFLVTQKFISQRFSLLQASVLLLSCIPLVLVFVRSIVSYIRMGRVIWREHSYLLTLSLAWFVPYAIFIYWWEPYNLEFWIALLAPVWIIVSLPLFTSRPLVTAHWRYISRCMLPFTVVCMFCVNLFGSMLPLHSVEYDYYFQRSLWYIDNAKQDDLIICSRDWLSGGYLRRYTEADVLGLAEVLKKHVSVKDGAYDVIEQTISQALDSGGTVYITSAAVQPEPTTLESYGLDAADFTNLWKRYQHSWVRIDIGNDDMVYVLSVVQ